MSETSITTFSLMRAVRDSHAAKHSDRLLLDALVLRANTKKGYTCYPSYTALCADTGLGLQTLQRAAANLEKAKLIRRFLRRDRSNVWQINVSRLIYLSNLENERAKVEKGTKDADPLNEMSDWDTSNDVDMVVGNDDQGEPVLTDDDQDSWMTSGGAR